MLVSWIMLMNKQHVLDENYKEEWMFLQVEDLPSFVHKNMKAIYVDEQRNQINQLKTNLDSLPVSNVKTKPLKSTAVMVSDLSDCERSLSPSDVVLSFTIEVLIMEARGLKLPAQKIVYCTMEVEGGEKFQTDQAEASRPKWDTQGDFTTTHPLPEVKVKLLLENKGVLAFDDKEIAKLTCNPYPGFTEDSRWYEAVPVKAGPLTDKIQIKMRIKMDKPLNLKKCGYMYSQGLNVWKRWKKRYFILLQVSQYKFALCSYHEKKGEPHEMIQLDGYTVDYAERPAGDEYEGGKYFFCCIKEGNSVTLSTDDEMERQMWVHKISQATGQSHRPVAPKTLEIGTAKTNSLTKLMGDTDRARKFGLDEAIQADPCKVDHHTLFKLLQFLTLEHRLNDTYSCLGWFSPGQLFVLDEYCSRYGVRGCYRHLYYLLNLLDKAESGIMIDSTLLHYSYAFCASHVHGNRPDGIVTVTTYEKEAFEDVKERLWSLLTNQIINFRYSFPFGRPEGALKATLSLFERVMMKDISTPVPPDEFQAEMRKCLKKAALVNYTKVSKFLKIEDFSSPDTNPVDRLDAMYQLADHCIDLLQQNEEHHGEALEWFSTLMVEHTELFWSLFTVDLDAALDVQHPDTWDSFSLFQLLNDYFNKELSLRNGPCHIHLQNKFAPLVIRYVDLMESSIAQSVNNGFERESWVPVGEGCTSSEDMFYKLSALKGFIDDLHWPEKELASHLRQRIELMSSDMIEACVMRVRESYSSWIKRGRYAMDYVIPQQICVMFNVIAQASKQAKDICHSTAEMRMQRDRGNPAEHSYHPDVREFLMETESFLITEIVAKIDTVLEGLLKKLSRYDQGTIKSHIFSLSSQTDEARIKYIQFCQVNLGQIQNSIHDDRSRKKLLRNWYGHLMRLLVTWLTDRISLKLHPYQLQTLFPLVKSFPEDFAVYGLKSSRVLHSSNYKRVYSRLQVEETLESGEGSIVLSNDIQGHSDSDDDSDFSEED
ncbi:calcium-dependent secretion activator 1-like isoform X2 [Dendronephthya gigantea]|uniref:calcium-dependent secretion activator 1-like isoform X2 n=1 Tax=Dendronephthya gigantea TaxID=151771 RepID=UPI0010695762|nr:calcium-dependent secretion activator 1-like isoform X2 [Dendronephthya gigantea]